MLRLKQIIVLFMLTIASNSLAAEVSQVHPNIIMIVADDIGYGDLSCYGSQTIATPALDRMAQEGVRFSDFYVASPFCSPSRAALLTGRLPARCGVPYVLFPTEHTGLPAEELTIAEVLGSAGYATTCIGKWHLGWRRELRPLQQGFDSFYGTLHTNDIEEWTVGRPFHQLSSFEPMQLRDGDRVIETPADQSMLTRRYTERAMEFVRQHKDKPFFIYLAHTMPHIPQYASPDFEGKSKGGLFGDCVQELDWSTDKILALLRELKIDQNTLVIFTSDNGAGNRAVKANPYERFPGRSESGDNGGLRGGKGGTFEGGIRVPCIAWWPGAIRPRDIDSTPWSALDFLPTFAKLAQIELPAGLTIDGIDVSSCLLKAGEVDETRLFCHYFGVQLQAVREGRWKLIVPVDAMPKYRVPSLWFAHQPGLFEKQHRLWAQASLYDLATDRAEERNVAAFHQDVVGRLLTKANEFDTRFQQELARVRYLPGPPPPTPGQVRTESDDIDEWLDLAK